MTSRFGEKEHRKKPRKAVIPPAMATRRHPKRLQKAATTGPDSQDKGILLSHDCDHKINADIGIIFIMRNFLHIAARSTWIGLINRFVFYSVSTIFQQFNVFHGLVLYFVRRA